MQFFVFSKPFKLSEALLAHVERRFGFSLERVRDRVEEVRVRFTFFDRGEAGITKECRVRVLIDGMDDVLVTEEDGDLQTAIERAADKAGDAVARALEQKFTVSSTRRQAKPRRGRPEAARMPDQEREWLRSALTPSDPGSPDRLID